MKKGTKLYELGAAAKKLHRYMEELESPEQADRGKVMYLVHELNAAYIEWGFLLDVEMLRAPREEGLDISAEVE